MCLLFSPAAAEVYVGSMDYIDNPATLDTDGNLANGWQTGFTIDWQVSNEGTGPAGYDWFYDYTINVPKFAPRRLIIEMADSLTSANINTVKLYKNGSEDLTYSDWSVGLQSTAGNADMPEAVYGVLFDSIGTGTGNDEEVRLTFWSNISPGWGDFYSRCDGNGNRAFNLGFTTSDTDPTAPPSSGVNSNHILTLVPEPSAAAQLLAGMATLAPFGILYLIRRRRRP